MILTAIPAIAQAKTIKNNDEGRGCGTCVVILIGDEEGKIGAAIRFYDRIGPFSLPWSYTEEPTSQILNTTGPWPATVWPRFEFEYGAVTNACGTKRAVYVSPEGKGYRGLQTADFVLRNDLKIIVFIDIEKTG